MSTNPVKEAPIAWGLMQRRSCLVPTFRGSLVFILVMAALGAFGLLRIGPFLSMNERVSGGVLVVEGWVPDTILNAAIREFRNNHYDRLYVTGLPVTQGAPLSEYKNYAHIGAASLIKLGLQTNEVQAVPTGRIRRDRTYAMALSLKHWLREHGLAPAKVTVMTGGPHARRSRLMFEKALGKGVTVGVISVPPDGYDEAHWWHYSEGVRGIIGETLAYLYARFLFWPPDE